MICSVAFTILSSAFRAPPVAIAETMVFMRKRADTPLQYQEVAYPSSPSRLKRESGRMTLQAAINGSPAWTIDIEAKP